MKSVKDKLKIVLDKFPGLYNLNSDELVSVLLSNKFTSCTLVEGIEELMVIRSCLELVSSVFKKVYEIKKNEINKGD